jgi:hypothetical protein
MMGNRGCKGGGEYDVLTSYRRMRRGMWKPGYIKYFKRKFSKRMRRQAKLNWRHDS